MTASVDLDTPLGRPTALRASESQQRAAHPEGSVWVAANAGSGKTHVLVERLARLLLSGTRPTRILCLTFTNAAAAEMANRLYARLSAWSMMSDADLAETLNSLSGAPVDPGDIARARRLFPIALESPGGLKIHTIHAFCERLLHRFPLEAGVAPHFTVIDEREQSEIVAAARDAVMTSAATDPTLGAAMDRISTLVHDMSLDDLVGAMIARRKSIELIDAADPDRREAVLSWLAARLGVEPDGDESSLEAAVFADGALDRASLARAGDVLASGSSRDQALAAAVGALAAADTPAARAAAHAEAFRKKDGKIRAASQLMTKRLATAHPGLHEVLLHERERAEDFLIRMAGTSTLGATRALLTVAAAIIRSYETMKAARSLLDYDDLISRTRSLLENSEDAAWVLYKLDGGIDHILVDEAQDTSPDQWSIVQRLAEDMLAGESARTQTRTVFAVGDEKQSIFSFQGADPRMFANMRSYFAERAEAAQVSWSNVALTVSYRSTQTVLDAVDAVFADPELRAGLGDDLSHVRHAAHRSKRGRVEIWETVKSDDTVSSDPWTAPLDHAGPGDPKVVLARGLATTIAGWLREGRLLEPQGRPVRPGDIMILVRRRNAFVDAMVRELKSRGVAVAGVDRMRLGEQIVVQDLLALGRFILLPQDDLSLAELLKSPLIGLDEDELFRLAHGRSGSLWQSLRDKADAEERFCEAEERLAGWLGMADRIPPFDLYAQVLADAAVRTAILSRLGPESLDPINEFLNAALDFERSNPLTLQGFLSWVVRGRGEIKRDMDHGQDEVRVMTVHGAKGLEANIVILPDTCSAPGGGRGPTLVDVPLPMEVGQEAVTIPVWPQQGARTLEPVAGAVDEAGERERDEHARLLYVAMTRACDWLIVAGYEGKRGRARGCWYDMVRTGLDGRLTEVVDDGGIATPERRWIFDPDAAAAGEHEPPGSSVIPDKMPPSDAVPPVPDWAYQPVSEEPPSGTAAITPSGFVGAAPPPLNSPRGETADQRFSRGLAIHILLERLPAVPRPERPSHAEEILKSSAPALDPGTRRDVIREAIAVLDDPSFAPFLGEGARAEVPFTATITGPDGQRVGVDGRVDRLVVAHGEVHVLDFKTHRPSPARIDDVPAALITQMALYRAALAQVFGKPVRASLLWTETSRIMPIPGRILDEALSDALESWLMRSS